VIERLASNEQASSKNRTSIERIIVLGPVDVERIAAARREREREREPAARRVQGPAIIKLRVPLGGAEVIAHPPVSALSPSTTENRAASLRAFRILPLLGPGELQSALLDDGIDP